MKAIDLVILVAYFVLLIVIGFIAKKRIKTGEDQMAAGKTLSLWPASVGKAANICGGSTTVGGGAYGYSLGITGIWFGIGTMLMTFVFAPVAKRIKHIANKHDLLTMGDFMQYRYGRTARVIAGGLNAIAYAGFVASQIVATGAIISVLTGWSLNMSMLVSTIVVMIYSLMGGLVAIVWTDIMQVIIIYVGMVFLATPIGVSKVGGWSHMWNALPAKMAAIGSLGTGKIVAMLISTVLASFVLQASYSYTVACKDENTARDANWLSGLVYIVPAFVAIVIGIVAFVMFPGLESPNQAMGVYMVKLMPAGVSGLLLAAIIASTMSTSSTCGMMSATCFVQDFYKEFINPTADGKKLLSVSRITLFVVMVVSLVIAIYFPDIIGLILWGYALAVGGLLAPMLALLFWPRATNAGALAAMIGGGVTQLYLTITASAITPILISLPVSIVLMVIVSYLTPKTDPEKLATFYGD
ncbi:MAG TPA: hypothetical protein VHQ70_10915 [Syntrophomonadaceae bacterium]|nr:hypothetical protein [Syntrophomonadaceae bacterium]